MRSVRNIILLLILCVTATGLPLYADSLNIESFSFNFSSEEELSFASEVTVVSPSHVKVMFSISTDGNSVPLSFDATEPVMVEIYSASQRLKSIPLKELTEELPPSETTISKDAPLNISLDINQVEINIPNGEYHLKITPNIKNFEPEAIYYSTPISFSSEFKYIPAVASIQNNQSALKLYFTDNDYFHLIPITRIIPYTSTPLRSTIDHLEMGADPALGLSTLSPIPKGVGLGLNGGTANVYITGDLNEYESNPSNAAIAYESFVNSLTSINEVNQVQFYFNNRIQADGFHGRVMSEPHKPSLGPSLYVGFVTETDRLLLTPIALKGTDASVTSIFNQLKYSGYSDLYSYYLQPPVPDELILEDYIIEDGKLSLMLNDVFIDIYKDNIQLQSFMVDSLLYSFTSLEAIDSVEFKVNERVITTLNGVALPSNTNRLFINPETQS
ncbi:GerMN domain-containing protein [Alkaliphilus peptidifermentans]|uniref:Sporulation and spore germination n=1 Tax=Alkaliphilus peptidifermentans DSM 18978 TaxID=1120976 RepID=A0A1G5KXL1_9FIRM|nr:GerMN domain-containing protein [Alkaliphilus peptidifermentans]SCZ05423.1 Sporulation and spore germination [Alkaliphilus peptidifermentans DSM 18978]